jgi:hypothetical protein
MDMSYQVDWKRPQLINGHYVMPVTLNQSSNAHGYGVAAIIAIASRPATGGPRMGNRFRTPTFDRRLSRARIGTALTATLLAGSLSVLASSPAHADTAPAPTSTDSAPPAPTPEAVALAQAASTGTAVPVPADETDNSTTLANPDGTLTTTSSATPTQVQQNGSWVPVDPTLHTAADGTLVPNAAESSVAFSDGGTTALATLTSASGQVYAISWPTALPVPTVSGPTATYADILPGVNLQMTATIYGGYTENLVVTSASAAANPALADIHFNTSTVGLTLSQNSAGGVQAIDTSGNVVFNSPTPTMWSSPTSADTGAQDADTTMHRTAANAGAADAGDSPSDSTGPDTTLPIQVTGNSLNLLPPADALTGPGINYPVTIDPATSPEASPGVPDWTWIGSNETVSHDKDSNNTYDTSPLARVGFDDWCSDGGNGCTSFGITRSLFSMGSLAPLHGKHILGATFSLSENVPSSGGGTSQIDLHGAGAFDATTTWYNNNPTPWSTVYASADYPSSGSGQINKTFNVTSLFQNAIAQGYDNQTIVLEADQESGTNADWNYRQFPIVTDNTKTDNPTLSINYWSTADVPTDLGTSAGSGPTSGCKTSGPGTWIPKTDGSNATLHASLSSPDTGFSETGQFWYREVSPTLAPHFTEAVTQPITTADGTATSVSITTPALPDDTEYEWQAYATNPGGYGSTAAPSASSYCYFRLFARFCGSVRVMR